MHLLGEPLGRAFARSRPRARRAAVRIRAGDAGSVGMDVPIGAPTGEAHRSKAAWKFPVEAISRWEIGLPMAASVFLDYSPQEILSVFWDGAQIARSLFVPCVSGFPRIYLGPPGTSCTSGKM